MQVRNDHSSGQPPTPDAHGDLLRCRMAKLGLDLYAMERHYSETIDKVRRRCMSCEVWETCAVDLQRDPDNQVWEAYCPNSGVLNALSALTEVLGQVSFGLKTPSGH